MTTAARRLTRRFVVSSAIVGSTVFQLGFLPSCQGLLRTINPCAFLAFCEEQDIDLLTCDEIPCFDVDPTCVIPFATGQGCAGVPILPTPGPRP